MPMVSESSLKFFTSFSLSLSWVLSLWREFYFSKIKSMYYEKIVPVRWVSETIGIYVRENCSSGEIFRRGSFSSGKISVGENLTRLKFCHFSPMKFSSIRHLKSGTWLFHKIKKYWIVFTEATIFPGSTL